MIVAQLSVVVNAMTTAAEARLAALSAQTKAFTASAAAVSGGAMIAVGAIAAIGVAAGIAVHQAADFQTQLTQLVTGAGEDAKNLDLVRKGILQLATDTGTSTDQLTAGLYMIESGGYHGAAGLDILKAAAMGAKVGAADLGVMADATDTVLKNFGETGLTASQAVNTLIATVANGKTHMENLAASIAHVLPTAASAGIALNDVMAAMATMTGQGVDAAEAATYLRQTMIALSAPGDEARKVLESIGMTANEVAVGMRISLPETIGKITDALAKKFPAAAAETNAEMQKVKDGTETFDEALQHLSGTTGGQYIASIKDVAGGMRQMQGLLLLSGQHLKTFKDDVGKISDAVRDGGASITGWNMVQGTFNQQIAKAGAGIQVLFITLGTRLLPTLTKVAAAVADAIGRFTPFLVGILSNKDAMEKLAPVLGIVAGIIGGVLVAAFVSLGIAMLAPLATFLVFAAPFIAVGVAVAALILIFKQLEDHFQLISKHGETVKTVILALAAGVAYVMLPTIGSLIIGFIGWAVSAGAAAIATIAATWPILTAVAAVALLILGIKALVEHWTQITAFLDEHFHPQMVALKLDFDIITGAIGWLIGKLGDLLGWLGRVKDSAAGITLPGGIRLPGFAEGGITPGGPVIVGERGPEILIPPAGSRVLPLPGGVGGGSRSAGGGSVQQQSTFIIQLDGRVIAQSTLKHAPGVIRLATGARSF
jgi:TP901 family phage tail tape measure protein